MDNNKSNAPAAQVTALSNVQRGFVAPLVLLGVVLAVVGIVVGVRIGLHELPVECPSNSGEIHCSIRPRFSDGIVIVALSTMAGIVILLVGIVAYAMPTKSPKQLPF